MVLQALTLESGCGSIVKKTANFSLEISGPEVVVNFVVPLTVRALRLQPHQPHG